MSKQLNKILSFVAFLMAATVIAVIAYYFIGIMMKSVRVVEGFSFSPVGYDGVGNYHEELAPMKIYDRWGYCDNQGKVQIVPQFMQADEFSSGLAAVQETKDGLYGYIDSSGTFIIKPKFTYAGKFSEELAPCGSKSDKKIGYIDKSGEFVIPEKYYEASCFSEGLAKVRTAVDGLYSFINRNDKVVIPADYTEATDFSEGLAAVSIDGKWGYIDKTGKMVIQPTFTQAYAFHEDLAAVLQDGVWGYIDKSGNTVIKNSFSDAGDFTDGYAPVKFDDIGLWGYINNKGETVITGIYQQATGFSDGVAAVREKSEWIFVTDNNFNPIEPEQNITTVPIENSEVKEQTADTEPESISNKNITKLVKQIQLHTNESVQLTGKIKLNKLIEKLFLRVTGEDGEDKGIYLSIKPDSKTYNLNQVSVDGSIEPFNVAGKYKLQIIAQLEGATDETTLGEIQVEVLEAQESGDLAADIGMIDSSSFPTIKVYMSVFDGEKNPVNNLTLDNFKLFETVEGQSEVEQKIEKVILPSQEEGLNIALVFDSSLSMYNKDGTEKNSNMEFAKKAAINFINEGELDTNDKIAIQSFGEIFKVNQDFTDNVSKLVKAVDGIKSQPDTAIYDTIAKSVDTLIEQEGKKCIIIFTDGEDTSSKLKFTEAIESAVIQGIPVYSIAIGEEAKTNELKSISDQTCGAFYYLKETTELNEIYKDITDKLKNQYQFTYQSSSSTEKDKSTEIKLVVTSDNSSIEAKKPTY